RTRFFRPTLLLGIGLLAGFSRCRRPPAPAVSDAPIRSEPVAAVRAPVDASGAESGPRASFGDPALLTLADQAAAQVSRTRGLAILRPIAKGVMDRPQILARLHQRVREEYAPGEVALEAEILRRLGLIPDVFDYEAAVFSLLEEQVAGFYDPSEQRLFIAS